VAWASLGKVDVVATALGKNIVNGRTKVIQPAETGVVRAIRVHDGSAVKAGDVLIELDPTINAAELDHVKSDLIAARLDIARLQAALATDNNPLPGFKPPEEASKGLIEMHRQFLASQKAEHAAKLAEIDRQLAQKQAERETIAATIDKLARRSPCCRSAWRCANISMTRRSAPRSPISPRLRTLLASNMTSSSSKAGYASPRRRWPGSLSPD
jgi:hemolysin D